MKSTLLFIGLIVFILISLYANKTIYSDPRVIHSFTQIKPGMSESEVISIAGDPFSVEVYYKTGEVHSVSLKSYQSSADQVANLAIVEWSYSKSLFDWIDWDMYSVRIENRKVAFVSQGTMSEW
jgi:hypothetical protein